jgi:L-alanine-DL-glutamate epimerase-like enolase superfamily enzyme
MTPTTITQVDATPLDMPLTEPFAIAKGAPEVAANVLVRIALADGTLGLGEAAPFTAISAETQESSLAAIESVRSSLVGQDARRYRTLSLKLGEALGAEPSARCAIETAILDAFTRQSRMPLWAFFGGRGTELDTDMTITAGDARHAAAAAVACEGRGIHTLKIKVGAEAPTLDAARIVAVHRATPGAKLLADANGGYTPEQAAEFLEELRANQVPLELFEQPVDRERWSEFWTLVHSSGKPRPASTVAICADESVRTAADLLALLREGAVDAVNIKPMKSGVVEALAIWNVATSAGLKLMIGGMLESVLAMSFSAHFAAGLGGFTYVDLDTPMFIREHPFVGGLEQDGARLSVARVEAGHGVTVV